MAGSHAGLLAVYPGTFDPITCGHVDIIKRGGHLFDKLIVAVSAGSKKATMFQPRERVDLILEAIEHYGLDTQIEVLAFNGLLTEFLKSINAKFVLRGMRALADFEYEFQMAFMNKKMNPEMETIFLPAFEEGHFISSRFVKEVVSLGGDISGFVPPNVCKALQSKSY